MLEGKTINLRAREKEDLPLFAEWLSNLDFLGEYSGIRQTSKSDVEKMDEEEKPHEMKDFFIEKKDGTKIGLISHFYVLHPAARQLEIGYSILPNERKKGYCTEAANIIVDYLFLSKNSTRIQACTDTRNLASQKVLENAGFKKEGTLRKCHFARGEWRDWLIFSILREEWTQPKILTKNPQK